MKKKSSEIIIPQTEVAAWVGENHPTMNAVPLRNWIWLADLNLQGDNNKEARESLKEYGFIYRRKGDKDIGEGMTSRWSHHCEHPIRFTGWKKGKPSPKKKEDDDISLTPAQLAAML